jgi:phosphoribosylanthranilate isomerase
MKKVRIKICGVTRVEDAEAAVGLGADFIGLNFWSKSPRSIDLERGRKIAEAVGGKASLVGVFVNEASAELEKTATAVGLDLVQFHGDETPEELAPWGERAMKAVRFSGELDLEALEDYKTVWGFLVEPQRDSYGGTGRSWNYSKARRLPRKKPFLLAGGLRPENVAEAIEACSPWGVDVCSGIESEPGVKDAQAMWKFFSEVKLAAG